MRVFYARVRVYVCVFYACVCVMRVYAYMCAII